MSERSQQFPNQDPVLERLLEEGIFDRSDPDLPDAREAAAMGHSAAMVQRLLMRIESLESEVRVLYFLLRLLGLTRLPF
jgi:hypothetical protein